MFRKASVVIAALLVATASISAPADAAAKISNGVKCAKKNATTKVGTDKYICTTNPATSSKALVWIWQGCIDAAKAYSTNKKQYDSLLKELAATQATSTDQSAKLKATIQESINRMILWKGTKNYTKDDVVYVTGGTYYIALAASSNKEPLTNLGTLWAVYQPTASDPKVGTSPDAAKVISWKEADVVDWTNTVTKLSADLTKLQGYKNPDAKTTALINQIKSLISTYNIGIKNANTNIKNLKSNVTLLNSQSTTQSSLELQKALILSAKADVAQALSIRTQSCAKGV